jgi:hypothetical protein
VLHFYDFSMIFYEIYKIQPKHFYYLGYQLQGGPRKELQFRNVVPGRAGRRGSPELRHSGEGFGRGMGGEGRGGYYGSVCGFRRVVEHWWAAGRWRPGGLAAVPIGSGGAPFWEGDGWCWAVWEAVWSCWTAAGPTT